MRRRALFTLPLLALLVRMARAAPALDLSPRPRPGLRLLVEIARRREVFDAGRWVVEARSAASARVEARAGAEGLLFAWRWLTFGADEAEAGPPPDPLRARMARLWEEVRFGFLFDPARGPRLADPAAARRSVEAALTRALSDVARELVAEGRPRGAVDAALAEVRRRFLVSLAADDALGRQLLAEPALLFELAGVVLSGDGEVVERERERPLDFAPGRSWPMRVEDRPLLVDREGGIVRLRRREQPVRPLDRRLLLDRIPGLSAMWRGLPESKRAEVISALPPSFYERVSRIEVLLDGARFPARITRAETSGLGTLRRRLVTELRTRELAPSPSDRQ